MEYGIARNWWVLALRGILAILFGVLILLWPGLAWLAIVATFAVYALADGFFAILAAIRGFRSDQHWWGLLLEGVFGISAGVFTIFWPGLSELALLFLIAYWAIATGIFEIVAAVRLRHEIQGEWLMILSGVLSIIFGIALAVMPGAGLLAVAWLIAAYSFIFGVLFLVLAFRLRGFVHHASGGGGAAMLR